MLYGSGLDRRGELIDLGIELGVIHKAGAWFSIPELPGRSDLATSWPLMLGQGREKVRCHEQLLSMRVTAARILSGSAYGDALCRRSRSCRTTRRSWMRCRPP